MATATAAAEPEEERPPREQDPERPLLLDPSSPPQTAAAAAAAAGGVRDVLSTYLGASFAVFLGLLPALASSHRLCALQARGRSLALQLARADEQIHQMRARRKEDCRANARVVEIFAGHRSQWQREGRRLVGEMEALRARMEGVERERDGLTDEVQRLRREVEKRDGVIQAITRNADEGEDAGGTCAEEDEQELDEDDEEEDEEFVEKEVEMGSDKGGGPGGPGFGFRDRNNAYAAAAGFHRRVEERDDFDDDHHREADAGFHGEYDDLGYARPAPRFAMPERPPSTAGGGDSPDVRFRGPSGQMGPDAAAAAAAYYTAAQRGVFGNDFFPPPLPKSWSDRNQRLQDMVHESLESLYPAKHFVLRRQSPWKIDGESSGVSSKLKLVDQELANLEKVVAGGGPELSKIQASMRKHAKRYQSLARKVDDLCKRMQVSDPSEPTLSPDFRSQRQTDFLVEAHRLQQRASETRQKLMALQVEAAGCLALAGDEHLIGKAKTSARKSLESVKASFKEIQRSLEVWVARIMGDIEGIMAREGASRVTDYYLSRYPVR